MRDGAELADAAWGNPDRDDAKRGDAKQGDAEQGDAEWAKAYK